MSDYWNIAPIPISDNDEPELIRKPRGTPGCKNCEAIQRYWREYDDSPLWGSGCNCDCDGCKALWKRNDELDEACQYIYVHVHTDGWRDEIRALNSSPIYYHNLPYGSIVKCKPCAEKLE